MSYLQPPPDMSPVVVVKDYGGYVDQYEAQTELYRRTNREVRIHECHSACTMALSLPNVCVYPNSIFKFHQAYDPRNHETNWAVSDELFNTYPVAVRERLGTLTKSFTVLRGEELIALGVRACGEPQPQIILAQTQQKPLPGSATFAMLTGKLQGLLPKPGPSSGGSQGGAGSPGTGTGTARPKPADIPDGLLAKQIPLPPEKPAELAMATPDQTEAPVPPARPDDGTPLPPPRPKILVAARPGTPSAPVVRIIAGAQSILPPHFVPFPKRA